ncbi:hypothetical protein MMC25_001148 [Agyrium rufum]|nr:hypothetical protein [Agyrium rufum]
MPDSRAGQPLVWIDCEMTGLNRATDTIMSIACYITSADLIPIEPEGFTATIHHPASRLAQMDEWCTRTHGSSGLTDACIASKTSAVEAADGLLAYLKTHIPRARAGLLAGNSVHADKEFLRYEPWDRVLAYLHYRILDVSTIKEAVKRWGSDEVLRGVPAKIGKHTAREDILESMEEMRYYRKVLFGIGEEEGVATETEEK